MEVYNEYHMGDQLFTLFALNKAKQYLEDNNITVTHYMNKNYIPQIQEFVQSDNIILKPLEKRGQNSWIGSSEYYWRFYDHDLSKLSYNDFLVKHQTELCAKLSLPCEIQTFAYTDSELITRYEKLPDKYKNLDILFINSNPLSFQYKLYNKSEWADVIKKYDKTHKVAVTQYVEQISCTQTDKLTLKDIAAISTHTKYIVAINTGPVIGCLNDITIANVKAFIIFDDNQIYYNWPNFLKCTFIQEIHQYIL